MPAPTATRISNPPREVSPPLANPPQALPAVNALSRHPHARSACARPETLVALPVGAQNGMTGALRSETRYRVPTGGRVSGRPVRGSLTVSSTGRDSIAGGEPPAGGMRTVVRLRRDFTVTGAGKLPAAARTAGTRANPGTGPQDAAAAVTARPVPFPRAWKPRAPRAAGRTLARGGQERTPAWRTARAGHPQRGAPPPARLSLPRQRRRARAARGHLKLPLTVPRREPDHSMPRRHRTSSRRG